jgi:hypothetical protein
MRHMIASTVLALGVGMTAVVVPAAAASTTPSAAETCAVAWGSQPKSRAASGLGTVHAVRAGRHACFDRLVVVLEGRSQSSYTVRYVDHVHDDSGADVPLRGGATIEVAVSGYRFHPEDRADVDVDGFRTFRQVASGSSGDNVVTFGLGVRARLPFRVFVLGGGGGPPEDYNRLVIDVAHRW